MLTAWPSERRLRAYQIDFARQFALQQRRRTALVMPTGTGKAITAFYSFHLLQTEESGTKLILVTSLKSISEELARIGNDLGFTMHGRSEHIADPASDGISITYDMFERLLGGSRKHLLVVIDHAERLPVSTKAPIDRVAKTASNRILFCFTYASLNHWIPNRT